MSTIQTRLAEVLAEHNAASVDLAPDGAFTFTCECKHTETRGDSNTAPGSKREWLANHQAEMLEPVIRLARSGELLAAATALVRLQRYPDSPTADASVAIRNEATANAARWLVDRAEAIYTLNLGPDCLAKKCRACDGRAFDLDTDEPVDCHCTCHIS